MATSKVQFRKQSNCVQRFGKKFQHSNREFILGPGLLNNRGAAGATKLRFVPNTFLNRRGLSSEACFILDLLGVHRDAFLGRSSATGLASASFIPLS